MYELLDSGEGEKLERFGEYILCRPDPEALWRRDMSIGDWNKANFTFVRTGASGKGGRWDTHGSPEKEWITEHGGFKFVIRPTSFKHVGLFPEQADNWQFLKKHLKEGARVLNLFAYTGGATVAALSVGAEVTHVDASKPVVDWARKNVELNNFADPKVRYIVDDVVAFVRREKKRGNVYDAIIMDPPAFGHGPDGELWKIEEHFVTLFETACELLSDTPQVVMISGYASGYSALAFANNLRALEKTHGGKIEAKELVLEEASERHYSLPAGVVARWHV